MTVNSTILYSNIETAISYTNTDYSEILKTYGLSFISSEYYWQTGEINKTQGWIIHLSVIRIQLAQLIHLIIPQLLSKGIPFKIVRDFQTAGHLLEGSLGSTNLGKTISIYPNTDEEAADLAQTLIHTTKQFKGPVILTDAHLGSVVYTRYGSFKSFYAKDAAGNLAKLIYNSKGELVPDQYNFPFHLPDGIPWPFYKIASPVTPKRPRLLNYSYYPLEILKPDAKGHVIKALYFRRFWQIRSCLIKQGHQNMFVDAEGRDIQDRLKWQNDIYKDLAGDIPLPRVFDFFYEGGDCYLAMEYIKGISFNKWMFTIYKNRHWFDLSLNSKLMFLKKLLQIVSIIGVLHKKGYVHRDITPENFLIDKKGKIFLIDMELTFNFFSEKPSPPFKLGTPGFMSPEQLAALRPAIEEDIYALGAFMLHLFTNLLPAKFSGQSPSQIIQNVLFLTGEVKIAELLVECLSPEPYKRPSLSAIESIIKEFREAIRTTSLSEGAGNKNIIISSEEVNKIVQAGIAGLATEVFVLNSHWFSKRLTNEKKIGNEQLEVTFYEGWHTGMLGPLWLLARAKKAGFSLAACETILANSWTFVNKQLLSQKNNGVSLGLFMGKAGAALTISESLNSNLLNPDPDTINTLGNCFLDQAVGLRLSDGISGQGIALLHAAPWLNHSKVHALLNSYIEIIIKGQQKDGSWRLPPTENNFGILNDLGNGEAGIIWFLLTYLKCDPSNSLVRQVVHKSIKWLIKHIRNPNAALILLFIRAFEATGDPLYKKQAEEYLDTIHPRTVLTDYTLGNGLAALGDIYMEGLVVFKDKKWRERADWIAKLLLNNFIGINENAGHWIPDESRTATADLFRGNSGILHFLIRYNSINKFSHPLSPY